MGSLEEDLVKVEVLTTHSVAPAGRRIDIGVRFRIAEGWHIYWVNPGDSGLPTAIDWQDDAEASIGQVFYPVPKEIQSQGASAYGYKGEVVLLSSHMTRRAAGRYSFTGQASWLACKEACIPGKADFTVPIQVGEPAPSDHAGILADLKAALPSRFPGRLAATRKGRVITLAASAVPAEMAFTSARFLPSQPELVSHSKPQPLQRSGADFTLTLPPSEYASKPPAHLSGLLVLEGEAGRRAFQVNKLSVSP